MMLINILQSLKFYLHWIFCIDDCVLASEFKLNKPDLDVKVNNVKLMGRCKVRIENSITHEINIAWNLIKIVFN